MTEKEDCTEMKVDVAILKTQVDTLSQLCEKMDKVLEKIIEKQDRMESDLYKEIEKKKQETATDIKELHSRITTVDRNVSDKIELTERRIMEEIKALRELIDKHNQKEDREIKKILQWKWMAAGGILVMAWLVSHINFTSFGNLFK